MYTVVAVTDFTAAVADVVFLVDDEWLAPEQLQPSDTITAFGVVLTVSVASPQYPNTYVTIITGGPALVNAYWNPAGLVSGTPLGFNFGTRILYAVPGAACRIPIGIYTGHTSAAIADGVSAITSRSRWHARTCRIPVYIVALRQPIPGIRQQYHMPTKRRRHNAAGEAASESEGEEEARHINAQRNYDIVQETRQMAAIMHVLAPLQTDLAEISTLDAQRAGDPAILRSSIFAAIQRLYDNFQTYTNEVAANPELIELQVPVSTLYTQLLNLHHLVLQNAPTKLITPFAVDENKYPWETQEPEWETNTLTRLDSVFDYTANCNAIRVTMPSKPDAWQTASLATIRQPTAIIPFDVLYNTITRVSDVSNFVIREDSSSIISMLGHIHALITLIQYYITRSTTHPDMFNNAPPKPSMAIRISFNLLQKARITIDTNAEKIHIYFQTNYKTFATDIGEVVNDQAGNYNTDAYKIQDFFGYDEGTHKRIKLIMNFDPEVLEGLLSLSNKLIVLFRKTIMLQKNLVTLHTFDPDDNIEQKKTQFNTLRDSIISYNEPIVAIFELTCDHITYRMLNNASQMGYYITAATKITAANKDICIINDAIEKIVWLFREMTRQLPKIEVYLETIQTYQTNAVDITVPMSTAPKSDTSSNMFATAISTALDCMKEVKSIVESVAKFQQEYFRKASAKNPYMYLSFNNDNKLQLCDVLQPNINSSLEQPNINSSLEEINVKIVKKVKGQIIYNPDSIDASVSNLWPVNSQDYVDYFNASFKRLISRIISILKPWVVPKLEDVNVPLVPRADSVIPKAQHPIRREEEKTSITTGRRLKQTPI